LNWYGGDFSGSPEEAGRKDGARAKNVFPVTSFRLLHKSMTQRSTRRLFIAMDTPAVIKRHIAHIQDDLRATQSDVRWESSEKFHLTIKFLGSTAPDLLDQITTRLGAAAAKFSPLTVVYRNIGCFPKRGDPRIIWIGMEEQSGGLIMLQQLIDTEMAAIGFPREDRPFHPHVTIGRIRSTRRISALRRMMETLTFECQPVVVSSIDLMNSELKPGGSVYTPIASFPLGE
jgi:2'-5' RNA ligase